MNTSANQQTRTPNAYLIIVILAFFLRQALVGAFPIFYSDWDSWLSVDRAVSIVQGNWLGKFNNQTCVPPMGALFLAFVHLTGISYSLLLNLLHWAATLAVVHSLKTIITCTSHRIITFLSIYFISSMFSADIFAFVYRQALATPLVLLLFASLVSQYVNRGQDDKIYLRYCMLSGAAWSANRLLRDDYFWALPFVICTIIVCLISQITKDKKINCKLFLRRCVVNFVPVLVMHVFVLIILCINYIHYGVFIVSGFVPEYGEMVSLIQQIKPDSEIYLNSADNGERSGVRAVYTVDMIEKMLDNAPTTELIGDRAEAVMENIKKNPNELFRNDTASWRMADIFDKYTYLTEGAESTKEFCLNVISELNEAFRTGALQKRESEGTFMLPVLGDIKRLYDQQLWNNMKRMVTMTITNTTGGYMSQSTLNYPYNTRPVNYEKSSNIIEPLLFQYTPNINEEPAKKFLNTRISIINSIIMLYQKIGVILFVVGVACYLSSTLIIITNFKRKLKIFEYRIMDSWLVATGFIGSSLALSFGLALTETYQWPAIGVYYGNQTYPLLLMFELVSIFGLWNVIKTFRSKDKRSKGISFGGLKIKIKRDD